MTVTLTQTLSGIQALKMDKLLLLKLHLLTVTNANGSGTMLVIKIPSSELATLAYETLKNTRDR